ncbi:MAG: hypothetical protein ACLFVX_11265 [Archaeoglobaceae archaeon]
MDGKIKEMIEDVNNNLLLIQEFLEENPDVQKRLAVFIRMKQQI